MAILKLKSANIYECSLWTWSASYYFYYFLTLAPGYKWKAKTKQQHTLLSVLGE